MRKIPPALLLPSTYWTYIMVTAFLAIMISQGAAAQHPGISQPTTSPTGPSAPSTPDQPKTFRIDQPAAATPDQPEASRISQPPTSRIDQPGATRIPQPAVARTAPHSSHSTAQPGPRMTQRTFPDLLPLQGRVTDTADVACSFFSDLGAWHAYGLPDNKEDYGGFTGPLLMGMEGRWLANSIAMLHLTADGSPVSLADARSGLHYYPGLLEAEYRTRDLLVRQQLIFITGREARIRTSINNISGRRMQIGHAFSGEVLLAHALLKEEGRDLQIWPDGDADRNSKGDADGKGDAKSKGNANGGKLFTLRFDRQPSTLTIEGRSYQASFPALTIEPGKGMVILQSQFYYPDGQQPKPKPRSGPSVSNDPEKTYFPSLLAANEKRWNGYLAAIQKKLETDADFGIGQTAGQQLAVKSLITLITNWRTAAGDLQHDGVFPSASYQGFYGVWSWDSWKQAVALASFLPSLAKDNIRCLFDYQDQQGMVPDCVYLDSRENNWRDTKPPLAAWAVWKLWEQTHDLAFLREMYPRLRRYHEWWYAFRDNDKNGLCEYGSTDGTRIAAAWESGMDNAVRFDSARMVKGGEKVWSLNQESVDLNAYLYAEKRYLARICEVIGAGQATPSNQQASQSHHQAAQSHQESARWNIEATQWNQEAAALRRNIESRFYDEQTGYYFDYHTGLHRLIPVEGPEGWIPLWAGTTDSTRAGAVRAIMLDKTKFNTWLPLPTLAADHPDFNPANGYWRGPVWLDQFYYGTAGLRRYGYSADADTLVCHLFSRADGLMAQGTIRENYHPLTGAGLNAKNFSWSAAFILLLLMKD